MKTKTNTYDLVLIAVFAVLMAMCAYISIPVAVPFTMQTFGIFLTLNVLGGKRGTFAVCLYILMGAIGLPVFAGFQSGVGVLLGPTGGYVIGFVLSCLCYLLFEKVFGRGKAVRVSAMTCGMILCYIFGTLWFMQVYTKDAGAMSLGAALSLCVLPFIVPDMLKMGLALIAAERLEKILRKI